MPPESQFASLIFIGKAIAAQNHEKRNRAESWQQPSDEWGVSYKEETCAHVDMFAIKQVAALHHHDGYALDNSAFFLGDLYHIK